MIEQLKKDIEDKIRQFKVETDKLQTEFENTMGNLVRKGYKIEKDKLKDFMQRFWHTYPTKNPNEWEVAVPVFVPFNIGWFDRTEGGYNIFTINKYTKWLGEEIPAFITHDINIPQAWQLTLDGTILNFPEGLQEKVEEKFGNHLSLVEKNKATIKQGHEFDLIAEIIDSGSLPFTPKPILISDLQDSDFIQIWDEIEEKYKPLEIFSGNYSFQGRAWETFQKYGSIGVFWGMSFGKTILGTYIFSRIKGKKALVVPTKTLEEHWKQFFKWNCPRLLNEVEIQTYQGMSRGKWNDLKKEEYVLIGFDECLTKDTNIILKEGGIETIKNIKNKENIVGGSVTNKFIRKTNKIVKIYSSFGELESTETHPHIVINKIRDKHRNQWYNLHPKNIKTKMAYELDPTKDFLLVPESIPHTEKNEWSIDQLAFVSLIMCDGHIEKGKNVIKVCVSKDGEKDWVKKIFIKGIKSFGLSNFWEFDNKRGDYTIGCSSAELKEIFWNKFKVPSGKKSDKIDINNEIFYAPITSIKKFIDIAFSCEGWINYNKRSNTRWIYFSCRSRNFTDKLKLLLKKFGIHSNYAIHKKANGYENQYQLQIGSKDFNKFAELIGLTHRLKASRMKPNKIKSMNNIVDYKGKKYRVVRINKIRNIKKNIEVFDFKTTTHNFLANGILTHNCHFLPADSFSKLATIKTKYRFGLSATPYREDGRANYIMALTGYPIGLDWRTIINILGKEYHTVNVHIVKDMDSKYQLVRQLYNPERRTIIFINLLDVGRKISDMLEIPMISGETKKRLEIIKKSKSFVASRVLELGVSIKDLEHIIEADFLFGSRREEVQRTGRLMHSIVKGKTHDIIMTKDELESYGKRLYGLYEKGFRYKLIPHLTGISISNGEKKKLKPIKKGGISYAKVIEQLFKEGYFQSERSLADISKSLERRGVSTSNIKPHIFSKLNGLTKSGKLFKIESSDGYKFKQR